MCSSFSCFAYFVVTVFYLLSQKPILNFSCFNVIKDFPGGSAGKESASNAGDLGLISGLGRSPGGGHGNPPQYSCPENPIDRGAWLATVHRVTKSWTWLKGLSTHVHSTQHRGDAGAPCRAAWVVCVTWSGDSRWEPHRSWLGSLWSRRIWLGLCCGAWGGEPWQAGFLLDKTKDRQN